MIGKRILINDPDTELVSKLSAVLRNQGRAFDVITTADGEEALEILRRSQIDMVITGLHAPVMDGFQLLLEINRFHRKVKVIVMVGQDTLLPRATFKYIGADLAYKKPIDLPKITEAIFTELQIRSKGEVWGINLTSFLQMLNADLKTCCLTISKPGHTGRIYLEGGELVAAEYEAQAGDDALYAILGWDDPVIEIDYLPVTKSRNISKGMMSVLMEAQRRKDTDLMEKLQMRRHPRFNCLLAVDFNLENGAYHHLIRNMSEGGAYIESDAKVKVGDYIEMSLYSMRMKRHCPLKGKIVRAGPGGFGVQFIDIDEDKRAFLSAIREG